ncbi:hypothetical protein ADK60_40400 [Streptomyces sp. XY431]|uniref:hypothetical protein n=1 Tax=Streptomyces sp. XY431 TaxID=1415562 RepID=UPI0006ADF4F2|nr:hypothetical protein [Streptomyces sp. XY431]KOV09631.1 hypothetical protein ADK60_40400 [Streptomyces sp. XY431]
MSQSLSTRQHHLTVVNPRPHKDGRGVLVVGRIRPASTCSHCEGSGRVSVCRNGQLASLTCPVCSLSAVDSPEARVSTR